MATIPLSFGTGGAGSDDATATRAQVLAPYTAITSDSDDEAVAGTMVDKSGTNQDAEVDQNGSFFRLKIPVAGFYSLTSYLRTALSSLGNAAANQVLKGATFTSSAGINQTGTIESKSAQTYYTSGSDQKINAGQYLNGDQIFKGVTTSNIAAGNILNGVNIRVGDSTNSGRIANVTGNVRRYAYAFRNITSSSTTKTYKTGRGNVSFPYITINAGFYITMVSAYVDNNNHNSACSDRYYGIMVRSINDSNGWFCEDINIQDKTSVEIPVYSKNTTYHVNIAGYY